jgi:two-component system sensor histidine kinase BaeS
VALIFATVLASLAVLGPVRRRLADLERAANAVEAGDLSARARDDGADEVAGLARAFNSMASRLDKRAQELANHERARRLLLADVSHELSTPLTSMRGYLETLAMPSTQADQATRDRYLQIVSDETRRLEAIVGDLLDLARLEAGGAAIDRDDVAVESLFGAIDARHFRVAEAGGVTLRTSIEPGAEIVRGDARRLEQALQNLVANALRHTPRGGSVTVDSRRAGSDVVLSVHDTGEGIAPEHLPRLFDRFYKVETARGTSAQGSGLGLSIVKAIVDRHGGTVHVTSSSSGTTFELRVPSGDDWPAPAGNDVRVGAG